MGALRSFFMGADCVHFYFLEDLMRKNIRYLAHSAILAAIYAALTHLQNLLLPGSANWAIQFRASEALCVLALFTPAAIPGLSIGWFLYNITAAAVLPLDFFVGSLATLRAAWGMRKLRHMKLWGYPLPAMLLPALTNAVFVGWELTVYIGGNFWLNALYVAVGETAVLLTLGSALYYAILRRDLKRHLFDRR